MSEYAFENIQNKTRRLHFSALEFAAWMQLDRIFC